MKQTRAIHQALKRLLRSRGRTYADAADLLELSEASIKRLFSNGGFSLQRIELICDWLEVEVSDLVELSEEQRPVLTELTGQQEKKLLADPGLLLVTFLVLNRWSEREILQTFELSPPALTLHLAELERLGMIEVLPYGRIKLRTARNFSWRANGPVQQYFAERILPEFLDSGFDQTHELMRFVGGTLAPESMRRIRARIDELVQDFDDMVAADLELPLEARSGVSLLTAFRPWEYSEFTRRRRTDDQQQSNTANGPTPPPDPKRPA